MICHLMMRQGCLHPESVPCFHCCHCMKCSRGMHKCRPPQHFLSHTWKLTASPSEGSWCAAVRVLSPRLLASLPLMSHVARCRIALLVVRLTIRICPFGSAEANATQVWNRISFSFRFSSNYEHVQELCRGQHKLLQSTETGRENQIRDHARRGCRKEAL
jgi:hypothetical protein